LAAPTGAPAIVAKQRCSCQAKEHPQRSQVNGNVFHRRR
jgi:hypothetical protein